MRFLIFICVLIALIVGCSGPQKKHDDGDTLAKNPIVPVRKDSVVLTPVTFDELNEILFDNLVNGEFGPHPIENDSGYYVLGIDSYKRRLRKLGIFSEAFLEREEERVAECKEDLEELKHAGDTDVGWAPNSCFFDYIYWLKSQENPTGYEIKNLKINERDAEATMVFFDEYEGKKNYWDGHVYLVIRYSKEGEEWKVVELLRLPNN